MPPKEQDLNNLHKSKKEHYIAGTVTAIAGLGFLAAETTILINTVDPVANEQVAAMIGGFLSGAMVIMGVDQISQGRRSE